jgi:hypothetical protein
VGKQNGEGSPHPPSEKVDLGGGVMLSCKKEILQSGLLNLRRFKDV